MQTTRPCLTRAILLPSGPEVQVLWEMYVLPIDWKEWWKLSESQGIPVKISDLPIKLIFSRSF